MSEPEWKLEHVMSCCSPLLAQSHRVCPVLLGVEEGNVLIGFTDSVRCLIRFQTSVFKVHFHDNFCLGVGQNIGLKKNCSQEGVENGSEGQVSSSAHEGAPDGILSSAAFSSSCSLCMPDQSLSKRGLCVQLMLRCSHSSCH